MLFTRTRGQDKPALKPYGFCCSPENHVLKAKQFGLSIESLRSLHECPALRLREQVVCKRPRQTRSKDGSKSLRSSSAAKLNSLAAEPGGLLLNKNATESEVEFMNDVIRARRQMEYEQRMARWANIGEKKLKKKKRRFGYGPKPYWYTDYSMEQLKNLKELEDSLFKDNEEKTTKRTRHSLFALGIMTEDKKIAPREMSKLLNESSDDPIKFLCEIYKALTGNYFNEEEYRRDYSCNERIILSGIAFLELPRIVLQLHDRLPPLVKFRLAPKPKLPKAVQTKKMISPLLETLHLPPNWRLYRVHLTEWRKKYNSTPKPIAILPKQPTGKGQDQKGGNRNESVKEIKSKKTTIARHSEVHYNETIKEVKPKKMTSARQSEKMKEKFSEKRESDHSTDTAKSDEYQDSLEKIAGDKSKRADSAGVREIMKTEEGIDSYLIDKKSEQDTHVFRIQTDWTNPPTPCPYKYRKILNQVGSLATDEEFFTALKLSESPNKKYPSGREHLSLNLQHFLLDTEADFYKMTEEANRLTNEMVGIAQEIYDSEQKCDACCSCRQTKKMQLKWHATKTPHQVIEGVTIDDNGKTCQGANTSHVIGALAMHSPASTLSVASGPHYVPSHEKFVKDVVIGGNAITGDGQTVRQVEGVTKAKEYVEREALRPDVNIVEIKNVPPCNCAQDDEELYAGDLNLNQKEELCYGKKFRPKEGLAYSCGEFDQKDVLEDVCSCDKDEFEGYEDECGCSAEIDCLSEKSQIYFQDGQEKIVENTINLFQKEEPKLVCMMCGMKTKADCMNKFLTSACDFTMAQGQRRKIGKTCSCNSLSKFLELDLTKLTCSKPVIKHLKGEFFHQDVRRYEYSRPKKISGKKMSKTKDDGKVKKIVKPERKKRASRKVLAENVNKTLNNSKLSKVKAEEVSLEKITSDGGPYGYRTASEEALPAEHTIAYLVDPDPTECPIEQIPVRPGGRPCRCRENRNNRKTLLYGIGGHVNNQGNSGEGNAEKVIEGVLWLTPEPSIRRSDEYILEYELANSPPDNRCGGINEASASALDNVEMGENIAMDGIMAKDVDTTIEKHVPCWIKCSKFKTSRKLKAMKPVCECKYERKIVKRIEERKHWIERQHKLKSMKKQSFLYVDGIAEVPSTDFNGESMNEYQTLISAVTMATPCNTPIDNRSVINIPYKPMSNTNVVDEYAKDNEVNAMPMKETRSEKSIHKKKSSRSILSKGGELLNARRSENKVNESSPVPQDIDLDESKITTEEIGYKDEQNTPKNSNGSRKKRRMSFINRLEEKLMIKMRRELDKMSDDGFISLKLPDYSEMLQLSYWISYRGRGMSFTKKYKRDLMEATLKNWVIQKHKLNVDLTADYFVVEPTVNVDYNRANYWKRQIYRRKEQFYEDLRKNTVNLGRELWRTMEFGKFPYTLFKQAYFTYLPTKSVDAYVVRPNVA